MLKNIIALLLGSILFSPTALAKKTGDLPEWHNPTPAISELGLDINTLANIIGKGQLIITHAPRNIELWTQGEVKPYEQVRFSSAITRIAAPAEKVRALVADTENYGSFMPQIRHSSIPLRQDKHFMAHYTQQYQMGPLPLKSRFAWQHTLESNGDISLLLHEGDIDAATGRFEFIAINEKESLLVLSTWQDLSTAKLTYRMMIKANPDFKATIPAVAAAILLEQYKDYFAGENHKTPKADALPSTPHIPLLSDKPQQLQTLIRLAEHGTLLLIDERQWYRDPQANNQVQSIVFASAVRTMPVPPEVAKPLILDLESMPKFTKEIKKVTISDVKNGKRVDARLKIGLGVIGISLDFHFDLIEHSDNVRYLLNGRGDMYPMLGAYEFAGFDKDGKTHTFGVLTQGGNISDSAPYMVRLIANKLPQFDFIRTIFSTLPQIEKQQNWVMEQLNEQKLYGE